MQLMQADAHDPGRVLRHYMYAIVSCVVLNARHAVQIDDIVPTR